MPASVVVAGRRGSSLGMASFFLSWTNGVFWASPGALVRMAVAI
jgi:hypothetical protein